MRRFATTLAALAIAAILSGCGANCDRVIAQRGLTFVEDIGDEYVGLVEGSDAYTEDQKAIRRDRVEAQKALMRQALEGGAR